MIKETETPGPSRVEYDWIGKGVGKDVVYESSVDYLEEFWGDKWPALRRELEVFGPDRLARYEELQLTGEHIPPPIDEIEDEIFRLLLAEVDADRWIQGEAAQVNAEAWPEELTAEFVAEKIGMTPGLVDDVLIRRVEDVAHGYRMELQELRDAYYVVAREAVLKQSEARDYVVWPLVQAGHGMDRRTGLPAAEDPRKERIFSLAFSYWGVWIVHMYIRKMDYPIVLDRKMRMKEVGQARLKAVGALRVDWK